MDAELVDDRLPALTEPTPLIPASANDPDAWLPPEAQEDVAAGIADATRTAYEGHFKEFAAWCATFLLYTSPSPRD